MTSQSPYHPRLFSPEGPYTRKHDSQTVNSTNPSKSHFDFSPIQSPKTPKTPANPISGPSPSLSNFSIISPPHDPTIYRSNLINGISPNNMATAYMAQVPPMPFPQPEIPPGPYSRSNLRTYGRRGHSSRAGTNQGSDSGSPSMHSEALSLVNLPHLREVGKDAFNLNPNNPFLGAATNSTTNLHETLQSGSQASGGGSAGSSAARFVGGFAGGIKKVFGWGNKRLSATGSSPNTSFQQPPIQFPTPMSIPTPAPNSGATDSLSRPPTGSTAASAGTSTSRQYPPMAYPTRPYPGFTPSPTPSPNQPVIIPPPPAHRQTQEPHSSSMSSIPLVQPTFSPAMHAFPQPNLGSRSRQPSASPASSQSQNVQQHPPPPASTPSPQPAIPHHQQPIPVIASDISPNFSNPVAVRPRRSADYMQMEGMPGGTTSSSSSPMAIDSDGTNGGGGARVDASGGAMPESAVYSQIDPITPSSEMNLTAGPPGVPTSHQGTIRIDGTVADTAITDGDGLSHGRSSTRPPPGSFEAFWLRVKRWWNVVNSMPWVAEDRVTKDYYPHKGRRAKARAKRRMVRERERERVMALEKEREREREHERVERERQRERERERRRRERERDRDRDRSGRSRAETTLSYEDPYADTTGYGDTTYTEADVSIATGTATGTQTTRNHRKHTRRKNRRRMSIFSDPDDDDDYGEGDRTRSMNTSFSTSVDGTTTMNTYTNAGMSTRRRGKRRISRPFSLWYREPGQGRTATESPSPITPTTITTATTTHYGRHRDRDRYRSYSRSSSVSGSDFSPTHTGTSRSGTPVQQQQQPYPAGTWPAGAGAPMAPPQGMYLPFPVTVETTPEGTQILKDPRNGAKYVIPIMLGAPPFANYWGGLGGVAGAGAGVAAAGGAPVAAASGGGGAPIPATVPVVPQMLDVPGSTSRRHKHGSGSKTGSPRSGGGSSSGSRSRHDRHHGGRERVERDAHPGGYAPRV
ncbi:hypothetical protein AX16_003783 [Volvariella volvacea WC 439]|nr:hypothetical protein AX16_003783 [Volvariella volvacea WC 439]